MFDMKEFIFALLGFAIFQICAFVLAGYAHDHSKFLIFIFYSYIFLLFIDLLTDLIVRFFFIIIQIILMLIFESKLHFFQHKILCLVVLNAVLLLMVSQMNPIKSYVLLYVISYPYFYRLEESLSDSIDQAFVNDVHLDYYTHKSKR